MSNTIIVKVSDLYSKILELKEDNIQKVELTILDADNSDPDDILPKSLSFTALSNDDESYIDYEYIEDCE